MTDEKPIKLSEATELPEEIQETLDQMREDPNYGVRWGRLRHKPEAEQFPVYQAGHQTFFPAEEQAEVEDQSSDEESYKTPHWLLLTGVGLVIVGLLIRWLVRRR